MKKLILVLLLTSACATANNAPNLTPVARNAYNLIQLQNAIGILQTTAEASVPNHVLSLPTARRIVQFCVTANETILQVPNGWYPAVSTAEQDVKNNLTPAELQKFGLYFSTFETVLNSFGS